MSYSWLKSVFSAVGLDLRRIALRHRDDIDDLRRIFPGDSARILFDIGANEGQTATRLLKAFSSATVHSFEPTPALYEALSHRADGRRWQVHPFAVSDSIGTATFHLHEGQSDVNSLLPAVEDRAFRPTTENVVVQTTTLEHFCDSAGIEAIDILKLDIQGAELLALNGAAEMLRDHRVSSIVTEVNFWPIYKGQAFAHEIFSLLHGFEYWLYGLYDLAYEKNGTISWGNAIFLKRELCDSLPRFDPRVAIAISRK
ncbi:MAG: FkbM family methyltransferase [Phycisphaerales bacterium]|nr:FkbM family methyltransferase [Phycisphaerales bacterium]MCB9854168.1 FkbM family methyltransferase [Phycisphaerales bacterium]MCB9864696.1 FkbM family methyltransferase [Phycisphaerales bacterium]